MGGASESADGSGVRGSVGKLAAQVEGFQPDCCATGAVEGLTSRQKQPGWLAEFGSDANHGSGQRRQY